MKLIIVIFFLTDCFNHKMQLVEMKTPSNIIPVKINHYDVPISTKCKM